MAAVALTAAAPLAWLGWAAAPTAPAVDSRAAVTALGATLGTARERAAGRAQALADLKVLADVVATDAATVRDLTSAERGFRPRPDERIEVGQVAVGGGAVSSLLRVPDGAPALVDLERLGARATLDDGALVATEVVAITPSDPQRAAEVRGILAVSVTVDLAPVTAALAGRGAQLVVGDRSLDLGGGPGAGATTLDTIVDGVTVRLAAPAAPPAPRWPRVGAALAAALGVLSLGLGLRRRRAGGEVATGAARGQGNEAALPVGASPAAGAASTGAPTTGALTRLAPDEAATAAGPAPTEVPADGPRFGRYQTQRLLGSGGMADVYLARATGEAGFARRVALKVLQPHMARRPEAVGYFLNEGRLAARLTHPCVVQVYDLGRAGADYFLAMEYIDGADLDRLLRAARAAGAPVPAAIALAILRRVCDGLHAAHTATGDDGAPLGIIHRDVKSANVLVSADGAIKVGDFGIARAAVGVRTTTVGQTRGTVEVMAPEQRTGGEIDVRADVYGVAAIGYELLSGAPVNLDLAILLQHGIPGWPHLPPLVAARPELPAELDRILFAALAFDAADRPASCAALEEQLAAVARAHGLAAGDKDVAAWLAALRPHLAATDPAAYRSPDLGAVEDAALPA